MAGKSRWRALGIVAAALALAGGGAGVAYAVTAQATPSSDVITACVDNVNGMTRIVSDASQCRRTEHPVELAASQAPRTVPVDCATGGSIGQALADEPVIPPLTIDITGTCTEAVAVNRGNVTLQAAEPGAGIAAPASADSALSVDGTFVTINGLTLTGGQHGLHVGSFSSVSAYDLHVTGARTGAGVHVAEGGNLMLVNPTIEGASTEGLHVTGGGSASVQGGSIKGATGAEGYGVLADIGSFVLLENVTIEDNAGYGVSDRAAKVTLGKQSLIQHNGGGIAISQNGTAGIEGSTISNNSGDGVHLFDTSLASFGSVFGPLQIEDNTGWGIFCEGPPALPLITGDPGTVTGNTAGENNCQTA